MDLQEFRQELLRFCDLLENDQLFREQKAKRDEESHDAYLSYFDNYAKEKEAHEAHRKFIEEDTRHLQKFREDILEESKQRNKILIRIARALENKD